ncbi:MAG: hypothetical protein D6819_05265 [Gammaproteobacteria bacterium]|nr:MAG: hypothetical protein D6819_05265 [Gammaproteobacteria bacterium]
MDPKHAQERPDIALAGIVYGDIIYWTTILASVITAFGLIMTFVSQAHHIDPSFLLSEIWSGKSIEQIWIDAVGEPPEGHWYIHHITTSNGITMAGIALGVFSVIPALLASALVLFKEGDILYGVLAVIAAFITIGAMMV